MNAARRLPQVPEATTNGGFFSKLFCNFLLFFVAGRIFNSKLWIIVDRVNHTPNTPKDLIDSNAIERCNVQWGSTCKVPEGNCNSCINGDRTIDLCLTEIAHWHEGRYLVHQFPEGFIGHPICPLEIDRSQVFKDFFNRSSRPFDFWGPCVLVKGINTFFLHFLFLSSDCIQKKGSHS